MASAPLSGVAHRLEMPRLTLRPFDSADAEDFAALVQTSVHHLLPWQPWAAEEPRPLDEQRVLLDDLGAQLAAGTAAHYAVVRRDDRALLGSAALVTGAAADRIEIGYWVGAHHVRQGYATEAAAALTRMALAHLRLPRLELWADADNEASNAVARRIGYRFIGIEPSYLPRDDEPPLMNVWSIEPDALTDEPLRLIPRPRLFDSAGNEVAWEV